MSMDNTPNRGDVVSPITVTLSTTTETTLQAGTSGVFFDLASIVLSNTSSSAVRVDIRSATAGDVVMSFQVPAGDTRGAVLSVPRNQATAGANWTAQLASAVTDVRISAQFLRRI